MQQIPSVFDWHEKEFWWWPDDDHKLKMVNDWVNDLDKVLPLIENKGICIQAGGACGIWPAYLSKYFKRVFTFEPVKENYDCLLKNIEGISNISAYNAALGDIKGHIGMALDAVEAGNSGAYYVGGGGQVSCYRIDEWFDEKLDFLCLDVEGFEYNVLQGAHKTIAESMPVIMIEEKLLPHMQDADQYKARQYLDAMGYQEALRVHRDVVFKPC